MLSSLSAVKDLLEMRGEYYSERPTRPIVEMYVCFVFLSRSAAPLTTFHL